MNGWRTTRSTQFRALRGPGFRWAVAVTAAGTLAGCTAAPQAKPQRPSVSVAMTPVVRASVPYTIEANGVVTPLQSAVVAAQVDGIIMEVAFREGQDVARGAVLFRIDSRPYQAAHDLAQAAITRDKATAENAAAQYERYKQLLQTGDVTREQAEQIQTTAAAALATVQVDEAGLKNASFNLDNTTIRAPISGRTGALLVRTGNLVRAASGTALVLINQVKPIMVRFSAPASELHNILKHGARGGLQVVVQPSGMPTGATSGDTATGGYTPATGAAVAKAPLGEELARGTLSFIDNAVDTTTGTVQLKATFNNDEGLLWVGQFVSVSLRLFVEENAIVVPTHAIATGQRGTYVYVIDSTQTAQQRPVVVERTAGSLSIVASGLAAGERVVTEGISRLTPGAAVDLGKGEPTSGAGGGAGKAKGGGGARKGGRPS